MLPELTEALLKLSSAPEFIPGDVVHTIERFVFLVYDRTSTCTDIDKACTKHDVQLIPPTKAALEEHIKRAAYQAGHAWGQMLLPALVLPPATSWGWIKSGEGVYKPYWTSLHEAAHTRCELL